MWRGQPGIRKTLPFQSKHRVGVDIGQPLFAQLPLGVDDVLDQAPAAQIVDRLVETLQDGADGHRARRALHGLVRVVAGV